MINKTFNKHSILLKNRDYLKLKEIKDNLHLKNTQEVTKMLMFSNETLDSLFQLSMEYYGNEIKGTDNTELQKRIETLKNNNNK
jgi:hypothetical protein